MPSLSPKRRINNAHRLLPLARVAPIPRAAKSTEKNTRALYHVDFDELQINFDFNDKHRETLTAAKLPVLLNLCQCLAKSGGGRGENAGRAAEYAGQAIELDSTVRPKKGIDTAPTIAPPACGKQEPSTRTFARGAHGFGRT